MCCAESHPCILHTLASVNKSAHLTDYEAVGRPVDRQLIFRFFSYVFACSEKGAIFSFPRRYSISVRIVNDCADTEF